MSAFDLDRIRRETFVSHIDYHEEINSTNTRALALAVDFTSFPALVLADRQTAGRGRGNHHWWGGSGGLTFSFVLRCQDYAIPSSRSPLISLTAGLAVSEAVGGCVPGADVRLKWPNDVFVNGRKVCGILLETAANKSGAVVIGIGVNVNNSVASAPVELQSMATSLCDLTGEVFDRTAVLISILQFLDKYLQFVGHDFSPLAEAWRSRCYLHGRTVQVHTGQVGTTPDRATGVCQGIDDDGALILQTETGVVRCVSGVVAKIL